MADDNLRCEFHLTEEGWVRGTRKFFDKVQGEKIQKPGDAIATYELHIYQKSMWSKEERAWSQLWKRGGIADEELNSILENHPRPDEDTLW